MNGRTDAATESALRTEIIETSKDMNRLGINQGTSGNVSARWRDGFLITPSGIPAQSLSVDSIVWLPLDVEPGSAVFDASNPSSEWRFHRDILRHRPEIEAVVHTHSTAATAVSIHGRDIPAVHYMVAAAGGDSIRCAPYATFGSQTLSDLAITALDARTACLLAHHGVIAIGRSLSRALWLANEVEVLAKQYLFALQLGEPPVLSADAMREAIAKFATYGPRRSTGEETGH